MSQKSARYSVLVGIFAGIACLTMQAFAEPTVTATDWPQFRGIHRDGASAESGLLAEWPGSGPSEIWRIPIGNGFSGMAVVGDRLFTMYAANPEGSEKPTEFAAMFDAGTGKEIWRTPVGEKFDDQFGNGPRATPTVHGDSVYVMGSLGNFAALNVKDGSLRWELNLQRAFGTKMPRWGFSPSCLVDGEQVVLEVGGPDGKSYAALNRKNGEILWTTGDVADMGYSSPLMVEIGGKRQYVGVVSNQVLALDPAGKELWSYAWPEGETHSMPLFVPPDKIFASGAEGVGGQLLQVEVEEGKINVQEIWKDDYIRNHFSSSVIDGEYLYGFDNATLKCIGLSDAKMAWAQRGFGKGSLIIADGKLFILSDRGKLVMARATAGGYEEGGSVQALEGRSWTSPTLAGGRLFVRNHAEMVAYDVKG